MFARNTRQVFVERLLGQKKTAASTDDHCSLVLKPLVKPFEDNGSWVGAEDEIRTRDSLLGRQVIAPSSLLPVDWLYWRF